MKITRRTILIIFTFIVIILLSNISLAASTATYYDNGNVVIGTNSDVTVSSNEVQGTVGETGVSVNENAVSTSSEGFDVTVDENGVSVSGSFEIEDNVVKYVLLGVAFLVAFIVLLFGIIAIKKSKGQIKVK